MADPRPPAPVLLVVAAFSRHAELLGAARARLEAQYGPVALASAEYAFDQTRYYEASMGAGLRKRLWAFAELIAADRLAEIKLRTNALERELAAGYSGRGRSTSTPATSSWASSCWRRRRTRRTASTCRTASLPR
jgi:hypothetical protein